MVGWGRGKAVEYEPKARKEPESDATRMKIADQAQPLENLPFQKRPLERRTTLKRGKQ